MVVGKTQCCSAEPNQRLVRSGLFLSSVWPILMMAVLEFLLETRNRDFFKCVWFDQEGFSTFTLRLHFHSFRKSIRPGGQGGLFYPILGPGWKLHCLRPGFVALGIRYKHFPAPRAFTLQRSKSRSFYIVPRVFSLNGLDGNWFALEDERRSSSRRRAVYFERILWWMPTGPCRQSE
jgi:hypothetical protein